MSPSRKSGAKQTSLTSFFQKGVKTVTPVQIKKEEEAPVASPSPAQNHPNENYKRGIDSDEDEPKKGSVKRRRVMISSSDEEDAENFQRVKSSQKKELTHLEVEHPFQPRGPLVEKQKNILSEAPATTRRDLTPGSCAELCISAFEFDESLETTKGFSQLTNMTQVTPNTPKNRSRGNIISTKGDSSAEHFPHFDFDFLKPENIRDANKRRPDDPNYDPKTLYVPEDFLKKQTPAHQQWWKMKATNFDAILFFKVGKFYELFHMDAVIAVSNVDLTYMGQNQGSAYAHCGFPEISYGRYSDQLTNRGYKVARVEQTESKKDADDRFARTKCKDKVVRREICRVTTAATRSYGILEGTDDRETDGLNDSEAKYLLAITEMGAVDSLSSYGICFVDCSTAKFHLTQFKDDRNQSSLRTLLANVMPAEILFERNSLSQSTSLLLNTVLYGVPKQALIREKEFLTAQKTISLLRQEEYLGMNVEEWPEVLKKSIEVINSPMPKPREDSSLLISSLGAIIWYLKSCLIDVDMVTMRQFTEFLPSNLLNNATSSKQANLSGKDFWEGKHMVLDGVSLSNLHVLHPSSVGSRRRAVRKGRNPFDLSSAKNSLFTTVDRCVTPFGKRMLQQWICAPSCDSDVIEGRQEAIQTLMRAHAFVNRAVEKMRLIPDLERLFQRVHTIGLKRRDHPDDRAQLFENGRYNQRKIKDLVLTLDGIEAVRQLRILYSGDDLQNRSKLLDKCIGDSFPAMEADLAHFKKAFNRTQALSNGIIEPIGGVDAEYDKAFDEVNKCKRVLENYLTAQKNKFKCQEIKFCGTGKNRYQLEIPERVAAHAGSEYVSATPRKGFKRFSTGQLIQLVQTLTEAENALKAITDDLTRRVFADFDRRKDTWSDIVRNIAVFDCLLSLCRYSQTAGVNMCFPEFDFESRQPFLDVRSGQHPSLISNASNTTRAGKNVGDFDYIPNDCVLGCEGEPLVMLLTGPNMGGKSTLMRQISSLVILAQIGSMVPALGMKLTPVDRIFCRIGANDSLSAGQSTFFVELAETNVILKEATRHSLVLVDELGRGTSTFDGTAIAGATLKYIANKVRCPTLFSTHYHVLCEMVGGNSNIKVAHMACVAENENTEDPTEENITFLYTLTPGPCLKSYGFYTAKIAGISAEVVRRAFNASQLLTIQK